MTLTCINPESLPTPQTYTHVIVATGSKLVFIAGQDPEDKEGGLIGPGDLALQARQVFAISAVPWLPPAPGLTRLPRSPSTSSITDATTCR